MAMCATALQIAVGPGPHCKKVLLRTRLRATAFVLLQHQPWLRADAYVMIPFQMQFPDMYPKTWGIGGIWVLHSHRPERARPRGPRLKDFAKPDNYNDASLQHVGTYPIILLGPLLIHGLMWLVLSALLLTYMKRNRAKKNRTCCISLQGIT